MLTRTDAGCIGALPARARSGHSFPVAGASKPAAAVLPGWGRVPVVGQRFAFNPPHVHDSDNSVGIGTVGRRPWSLTLRLCRLVASGRTAGDRGRAALDRSPAL